MNPTIRNNERFKYLHELPATSELYEFIKYLDEKYHVNSHDNDNSFGKINPNTTTISNMYFSNILYFAKVDTPERIISLPKYQSDNPNDSAIILHEDGVTLVSTKNPKAVETPLKPLDDADLGKLIRLRLSCQKELLENKPVLPIFPECRKNEKSLSNDEKDALLEKQGFASHRTRHFEKSVKVPSETGGTGKFSVEYTRLSTNNCPHFSTSYECRNHWGQAQEHMNHAHPAYAFWKKWDVFHSAVMTTAEWEEMYRDLEELL